MKKILAAILALTLPAFGQTVSNAPDRLVRGPSKVVLSTDATNSTLTWQPGRLIFKDSGAASSFHIYGSGSGSPGVSVQGGLGIGKGNSLSGTPVPPYSNNSLLRISEDSSDTGWTTGFYMDPYQDSNIAGGTITIGNYATLFNNPFDSYTEGNVNEHYNAPYDGAVADSVHGITSGQCASQSFIFVGSGAPALSGNAGGGTITVYRTGDPGTLTWRIFAVDGAHKPTGSVISTGTTSASAITTNPAGEDVEIIIPYSYIGGRLTAATEYAIVLSISGAGTLNILSDDTTNTYTTGFGFTSSDCSTYTGIGAGGIGDFMFAHYSYVGVPFTLNGHQVQLGGSMSGAKLLGWSSRLSMFNVSSNVGFPSGSPASTYLAGYDINTLSVTPAPARSYGLRIGSNGNGTTPWSINAPGPIQVNTTGKVCFGGTSTTACVNDFRRGASTTDIDNYLNNVNEYRLTPTAFHTVTTGNNALGTSTIGWSELWLKDTGAAHELRIKATGTGTGGDTDLTLDTNNANRTISLKGDLTSGTWTPTLTNVANLSASTAYKCQYARTGNVVNASCKVDIDPTAAASTQLGISIPVASNFTAQEDCAGSASASGIAGQMAAIRADATNDRCEMVWIAVDLTNQPMYGSFTYEIK